MKEVVRKTNIGNFRGNERDHCYEFVGIKYAKAERFEYAQLVDSYQDYDATKRGPSSMQKRAYPEFEHLEVPARAFYNREYRQDVKFTYSEDSLILNIFIPKEGENHPVILFFHGGGFDSGAIDEDGFDGEALAKRGCVVVFAQYRVSVFGYFTHEEIYKKYQRDGSFGLDDLLKATMWVKKNISNFSGDSNNITLMGQSAGAMSIQYLLCSDKSKGLFKNAIMMSGAGLFPKFALPKPCKKTRAFWLKVMELCNCKTFEEFKKASAKDLLAAVDKHKSEIKGSLYYMMPVIDHYILTDGVDKLIKHPQEVPLMIGFTNNDLFTIVFANMAKKYAKEHHGYLYYFDIDAKGDNNLAFHSADVRYVFGTLATSWRPYDEDDYRTSELMMDYIAQFAKTGNPNHDGAPKWDVYPNKAMCFRDKEAVMGKPKTSELFINTFKGDPK